MPYQQEDSENDKLRNEQSTNQQNKSSRQTVFRKISPMQSQRQKRKWDINWLLFKDNRETMKQYTLDKDDKAQAINHLENTRAQLMDISLANFMKDKEFKLKSRRSQEIDDEEEQINIDKLQNLTHQEYLECMEQYVKQKNLNLPQIDHRITLFDNLSSHRVSFYGKSRTSSRNMTSPKSRLNDRTIQSLLLDLKPTQYIQQSTVQDNNDIISRIAQPKESSRSIVDQSFQSHFMMNPQIKSSSALQTKEAIDERIKLLTSQKLSQLTKLRGYSQSVTRNQYLEKELSKVAKQDVKDLSQQIFQNSKSNFDSSQRFYQDQQQFVSEKDVVVSKLRQYVQSKISAHSSHQKHGLLRSQRTVNKSERWYDSDEEFDDEPDESEVVIRNLIQNQRDLIQKLMGKKSKSEEKNHQKLKISREFYDKNKLYEKFKQEHTQNIKQALDIIQSNGNDKVLKRNLQEFITIGGGNGFGIGGMLLNQFS
ncbi:UNKNOWN [Stylonychia lemnae]|uniref:Uncharacterized protein n=1 Tax=Stylonychia lemnae TaxID=5949 RepID=A0A078AH73_STYLE|nr:UNKNOWN [Stylonychia lemnae]|eukprot:CDW81181.1 UNKNOWN [Stylonychia lemnae]